jgi:hypothetical protein
MRVRDCAQGAGLVPADVRDSEAILRYSVHEHGLFRAEKMSILLD